MVSPDVVTMVRFKSVNAELSDTEMDTFMSRLWRTVGRGRISQFLYTSLSNVAANQKYSDLLPIASGIINEISEEREGGGQQMNPRKLNDLPSSLVGGIASHFRQSDYIAFSKTNCKLFIDSDSQNRLQTLS